MDHRNLFVRDPSIAGLNIYVPMLLVTVNFTNEIYPSVLDVMGGIVLRSMDVDVSRTGFTHMAKKTVVIAITELLVV